MSEALQSPEDGAETASTGAREEGDEYTVRNYRDGDRERFLSLYESVWGNTRSPAWFEWRFERNPYASDVKMVVAEREGELVGAEPLLPLRMTVDGTARRAYQPVDWIVHPDHQRRGLFTRMTERLLESRAGEASFLFNFPTDALYSGLEKFDWTRVGTLPTYYRVQTPSAVLDTAPTTGRARSVAASLLRSADSLADAYHGIRDRLAESESDLTVERRRTVPTADLLAVYSSAPTDRIHVARDRAFYGWRFDNPRWETTTYLARRQGRPVASLIAATDASGDARCTYLVDAQPMADRSGRTDDFETLLGAVVADHGASDVIKAAGTVLPPATLAQWGFRRDDRFPLSAFAEPTTHAVRPLSTDDGAGRRVGSHDLTDPDDWLLALGGQDIE